MKLKYKAWLWCILAALLLIANTVFGEVFQGRDHWSEIVSIVTCLFILAISLRLIRTVEKFYIKKLPGNAREISFEVSGVKALSRLAQVGALLIFGLILLGIFQIPLSGLITVGGIGGIAIAYAGKDILSNFLGGVMIYVNRQFSIGDTISSPDRDIAGTIEQMGWRYTTIRRNDKQLMYVPNSLFSDVLLINASRMSHRLINATFGLRYSDINKIPAIFKALQVYLDQNTDIDQSQGVQLNISAFAASSINFTLAAYVSVLDKHSFNHVQDEVLLKVSEIVMQNEAEFAYPTTTLDLPKDLDIKK